MTGLLLRSLPCRSRTRHHPRRPLWVNYWYGLALLTALCCASCERQAPPHSPTSEPGQVRHFTGTWTATGTRQAMQLGSGHQATIFSYTGSLLLSGQERLKRGFMAEVIGFADSQTGMQGRSVWTDERGEKVFSALHSEASDPDRLITGRFLGGTGRYAGVAGEYTFKWQRLIETEYGKVSGRVVDLKGWARLEPPGPDQSPAEGQK